MGIGVSTQKTNNSVAMLNSINNSCSSESENLNQIDSVEVGGWGNKAEINQTIQSISKCSFKNDTSMTDNSKQNINAKNSASIGVAVNYNSQNISKVIKNMVNTKCEGKTLNRNIIGKVKVMGTYNKLKLNQNISSKTECGAVSIFKALTNTDQSTKATNKAGLDLGMIIGIIYILFNFKRKKIHLWYIKMKLQYIKGRQSTKENEDINIKMQVDKILDKLNNHGWDSLTSQEEEFLTRSSKRFFDGRSPN